MNTDNLCFIVTGDLAYFYDMNALGIRDIRNNVRVLVINNGGGAEFKILTRHWKNAPNVEKFISANGHYGSTKGWAESCGFKYLSASNKAEFLQVSSEFVAQSDSPIIFEIFTTEENDVLGDKTLVESNKIFSVSDKMKKLLSGVVGEKGVDVIKTLVKK